MKIKRTLNYLFKFLVVVLMLFLSKVSNAQTYARVRVLSGGAPIFIFNSLGKYNDGITLSNWTKLRLELNEDIAGHTGWELGVMARTTTIESDGTASLDLDVINIIFQSLDAANNATVDTGEGNSIPLSSGPGPSGYGDVLLEGDITGSDFTVEVTLSYECGTVNTSQALLGEVPDYYTVDLLFVLYSVP
jgi:hypothetical protein